MNSQDTDESQGESKDTQAEIDRLLGMSHSLFKHIVALNTYTEPFLNLGAAKQRELIEELLGITQLSQKAENLKELIKSTKLEIEQEEFKIRTIKTSNEKIRNTISEFQTKVSQWESKHLQEISTLEVAITSLEHLDIDTELSSHKDMELYNDLRRSVDQLTREYNTKQKHVVLRVRKF